MVRRSTPFSSRWVANSEDYAEFRTMPGNLDQSAKTTPKISVPVI